MIDLLRGKTAAIGALAAAMLLGSPGLPAYQAFAGVIKTGPGVKGIAVPALPASPLGAPAQVVTGVPTVRGIPGSAPALQDAASVPVSAELTVASAQLAAGSRGLALAKEGETAGVLQKIYSGTRGSVGTALAELSPQNPAGSKRSFKQRLSAVRASVRRAASGPRPPQLEDFDTKAFWGLFSARTFSILAFMGTTLAYPKIAQSIVSTAEFGTLVSLGTLVAVAAGPLTGKIADKFSARAGMALNTVLRAVFLLDLPVFTAFGILNFWTLLLGSIANGWLLSSIMTTEGAYMRRLFGVKNLKTVNALSQLNYFALQIFFGLILQIGKLVDRHDLMLPFYVASAVNLGLVLPIILKTMPNTAPSTGDTASAKASASRGSPLLRFLKDHAFNAGILAAAIATFPFLHSSLPIVIAMIWLIARTEAFKVVAEDRPILFGITLASLGAFVFYALQSFMLPKIAYVMAGHAGASLLNGKLLGALFLGQMIASSSLAKLPELNWPLVGRFGAQRLVQGSVLAMVGLWVFTGLFPGSWLAAAAAIGAAALMMKVSGYFTDRGWLSLLGIGMGFLALPALFWGNQAVLLSSLLMFGFFFGPVSATVAAYVQGRAKPSQIGAVMGMQGSMFNAAISLGIGSVSLIATHLSPILPPAMWVIAGMGAFVAAVYFFVTRRLPGLSESWVRKQEDVR